MKHRFLLLWLLVVSFVWGSAVQAQNSLGLSTSSAAPARVTWKTAFQPADARRGEVAYIVATAQVPKGWHMYSTTQPAGGPLPTSFKLLPNGAVALAGKPLQPKPKIQHDEGFGINVELLEGTVVFRMPVKIKPTAKANQMVSLQVRSMICNDQTCLPPEQVVLKVLVKVASGAAREARKKLAVVAATTSGGDGSGQAQVATTIATSTPAASSNDAATQIKNAQSQGVLPFMALAFGAGLIALLTPCVFPMIPITVSVFAKPQDDTNSRDWLGPVAYCLGIIGTFTVLGLVVSGLFGASGITRLAANPWLNLGMAALFIGLALNLFGAYEIMVPASVLNRVQPKTAMGKSSPSTRSRLVTPLLMGLAFTLTSFTCTVPFVATTLVSTAQGETWWPLLGMLSFSTAFALPFFLLALFPQWLSRLPKSGNWLRSVKVVMGFLELAAAVKFLSQADFALDLQLLTRPIFLALWAVIAFVAGFYLLSWVRLPHDDSKTRVSWSRRGLGVATLAGATYLLLAINGASLGELDAYPPPASYGPNGVREIAWERSYEAALAKAKAENKPLLINFTGYACTNCRLMENRVLPQAPVLGAMREFVAVELYTDGTDAESKRNSQLQQQKFKSVALPLYVVVSPQDEREVARLEGLHRDPQTFVGFLQNAHSNVRMAQNTPSSAS